MPRIRPLRKPEDIAAVPPDEPVMIDLTPEPPAHDEDPPRVDPTPSAPEPEPPARIEEPDATTTLRKQLEAAQQAEKLATQRAENEARARAEAERRAQEQAQNATRFQGESEQAQYDAIVNALSATESDIEAAKRDVRAAGEAGDWGALAEAQARLGEAGGRRVQLADGKAAFESRREELKHAPPERTNGHAAPTIDAQVDAMPGLTIAEKDWLKQHPDALSDPEKNAYLGAAYWEATKAKGLARNTPQYFQFLEERLGYRQPEAPPNEDDEIDPSPPPARRIPTVSAPVSRDIPSAGTGRPQNSQITLAPAEREAAAFSGISEVEYARQKVRLLEEKKRRNYVESR